MRLLSQLHQGEKFERETAAALVSFQRTGIATYGRDVLESANKQLRQVLSVSVKPQFFEAGLFFVVWENHICPLI
jgi:hypothetical protein